MSRRAASVAARVAESVRQQGALTGVRRVRVGFSGGADSTALLLLLQGLHHDLEAVHLHHGIRGAEADDDARWCEAFCAARGIPFVLVRLDVPGNRRPGESLEEAGRRLRLEYWARTTPRDAAVALGHHLDDCLEDMLLRLTRGANAGGLTAMRPSVDLHGVRIIRPLLGLRRREIEALLTEQGIDSWRQDASNRDTSLRRNAVRHQWLPLLRQTVGHDLGLERSLEALREDADCLAQLAQGHLEAIHDLQALRQLHPALLPRVLRLWLRQETDQDCVLPRQALLRLRRQLVRGTDRPCRLPIGQGRSLELSPAGLRLLGPVQALAERCWAWRESPRLELPEIGMALSATRVRSGDNLGLDSREGSELFAEETLPETIEVRPWRPGDRLVPFGRRHPVKLQDLFTKAPVRREQRARVPVLLCRETVIWVPGVRRAEFGRVQPGTQAVRLRLEPDAVGPAGYS